MKRILRLFVIPLAALVFLVSCITFEENYNLKNDGSGSYEFKVDMSQLVNMMKMMEGMNPEGEKGKKPTDDMDFKKELEKIKKMPGISNVKSLSDEEKGFFSLSFDFKDFASFNKARHEILDSGRVYQDALVKKGDAIFFHHITPGELSDQGQASEEDSLAAAMGAGMLEQFQYKVTFTVEKAAKSVTTKAVNNFESSNKKSFTLESTVKQLVDDPQLMDTEIKF